MKIRKISFQNHEVFGNLDLDFTDKENKTVNTIIIAGENGVGKSLLLNTIFEFSALTIVNKKRNEKRSFEIELSDIDISILEVSRDFKPYFTEKFKDYILFISIDYNITDSWNQIVINGSKESGESVELIGNLFSRQDTNRILRMIFSDVEINFNPKIIQTVTSSTIDNEDIGSVRSNQNLATEIAQLLIDVQTIDALEFTEWARSNGEKLIDNDKIDVRIKRFTSAFHYMFPAKRYSRIENVENHKQIVFVENGREMGIDKLSSGEKQVVFRGSFLLKNRESSKGALILIDEPEISLHPSWQLKILSYFKKLFTNNDGQQTSQLIVSTHSPFIIHNFNRIEDKVIVLQKDTNGSVNVVDEPKFYSWSPEQFVKEAFNITHILDNSKVTVFLGGKTDEKYFSKCIQLFERLDKNFEFKWVGRINEMGNPENTGDSALNHLKAFVTANMDQIKNRVILFYDCETNKPEGDIENLLIRKMNSNSENNIFKIGVENLLTLIQEIDTPTFYKVQNKKDSYGAESIIRELDKTKLCSFICDELSTDKQKIVLKKIDDEINRLITE